MKRHGMKILIMVMNDGAYGSEVHKLRSEGMPDDGSVFGRPDFAAIARGFGIGGKTFKSLTDVPKAVEEFACGIGSWGSWDGQRPSPASYVATDGGQGRGHHPRSAFVLTMLPNG